MRKYYFRHIVPKPFYWKKLEESCKQFRADDELLVDFLSDLYRHTESSLMSYEEFTSYDHYERDSFLSSLSDALVDNYKDSSEYDYDYADYYQSFVDDVLWAPWFKRLLYTINEDFETARGTIEEINVKKRHLDIKYIEK